MLEATQGGLLFAAGNLDNLVKQWESLRRNPDARLRLAATGQQRVREKFSTEVMADQSLQLFESLCRGKNSFKIKTVIS